MLFLFGLAGTNGSIAKGAGKQWFQTVHAAVALVVRGARCRAWKFTNPRAVAVPGVRPFPKERVFLRDRRTVFRNDGRFLPLSPFPRKVRGNVVVVRGHDAPLTVLLGSSGRVLVRDVVTTARLRQA